MPLHPSNLAYPVLVEIGKSRGSGFFLNDKGNLYLITARHVLFENGLELFAEEAKADFLGHDLKTPSGILLDCRKLFDKNLLKKHQNSDVAAIKIGVLSKSKKDGVPDEVTLSDGVKPNPKFKDGGMTGVELEEAAKFENTEVSHNVFVLSYPTSLGKEAQIDRTRPLVRQGIVAGTTEDRRIVIDCPVYFGNSGGLVIQSSPDGEGGFDNRAIGVVTDMVPFIEDLFSLQFKAKVATRFENSGFALVEPLDRVIEVL